LTAKISSIGAKWEFMIVRRRVPVLSTNNGENFVAVLSRFLQTKVWAEVAQDMKRLEYRKWVH
jgi:hypothetical protein